MWVHAKARREGGRKGDRRAIWVWLMAVALVVRFRSIVLNQKIKKRMQKSLWVYLVIVTGFLGFQCATTKVAGEAPVGVMQYEGFRLRGAPGTDTAYYVVTSEADFNRRFEAVEGSGARPDFGGQTAVAIYTPGMAPALVVERAAIRGSELQVYAITCNGKPAPCSTGLTIATTPRSGSVTSVRFFVNGRERKTVNMEGKRG
jgi:hypothetical protein